MLRNEKSIVFLAAVLLGITFCHAAKEEVKMVKGLVDEPNVVKSSWFGLGFYTPLQLPDEDSNVRVARISIIYTYNKLVNGFDCGMICYSGNVNGLQTAWSNHTDGIMNGLTIGLFNIAEVEMNGLQIGIYNRAGSDSEDNIASKKAHSAGAQWGWANCADAIFAGFQFGITNVSTTLFQGLQIGAVNIAKKPDKAFNEFQSERFKRNKGKNECLQIGLINFNPNGFLPVCLLVNF